jgi:hypothetical protein
LPFIDDEKISCVPSGDHEGALFVPLYRGNATGFPESSEYMQICGPVTPDAYAKHVNAIRDESGAQRGVSEIDRRDVSGC